LHILWAIEFICAVSHFDPYEKLDMRGETRYPKFPVVIRSKRLRYLARRI
jgi:hypothetical protein